jgi:RNA polymerase sigma factor (TIGR02999 family)
MNPQTEVTQLLQQWSDGRQEALDQLLPQIYAELRRLAASYLRRERREHTLQPTALVNEAFLKLIDQRAVRWQNRAHFFGIAAQAMRRILVDHARAHVADKRGSGEAKVSLDDAQLVGKMPDMDILALDEVLTRLASIDPQQSRVVELR